MTGLVTASAQRTLPSAAQRPAAPKDAPQLWRVVLPWGSNPGQVGLVPAAPEFVPQGPSALAISSEGTVYVLDRLNGRVLATGPSGTSDVASVPRDAEDLSAGQGVLAAYSPLRARVFLRRPSPHVGRRADLGEVAVPRALRGVVGVSVGPSLQVWVRTAHQECYRVGSPHTPLGLAATLHSKREGGWPLDDSRYIAVRRRDDGHPELLVLAARRPHAPVLWRHALPEQVLAARVVGVAAAGSGMQPSEFRPAPAAVTCLRLELAGPHHGPRIDVTRRLVCLEIPSGHRLLDEPLPLPPRGYPVLRREVAIAANAHTLWAVHGWVDPVGLHLTRWSRPRRAGGQP